MSSCKHALDTRASRTQFDTRITAATACMWFLYSLVASKDKASCFGTAAVRLRPLLLLALRGTRTSAAHPWLRRHLHGRSVLSEALLLAQEVQPQLLELGLQDPRICQHQCRSSGVAATNVSSVKTKTCAWLTLLAGERPSQPDDRVQLAALYMLSKETLLGCRGPMQAMTVHFSPNHAQLNFDLSHPQQHGEAKRSANRSKASCTADSC